MPLERSMDLPYTNIIITYLKSLALMVIASGLYSSCCILCRRMGNFHVRHKFNIIAYICVGYLEIYEI